jgi:excisionase family DNA binding protein
VTEVAFTLPAELVEAIAQRAAEIVLERQRTTVHAETRSPNVTLKEAAMILSCKVQRVRNLLTDRKLTRIKDGGRTLIAREELERYLAGEPTGPLGAELAAVAHPLPRPYRDGFASAIRG